MMLKPFTTRTKFGDKELIGKSKKEICKMLGEEFNFYPANEWTYHLETNWLGRKKILSLHFQNDLVNQVIVKKSYK